MKAECAIWRQRFPHLRVIGKGILSNVYQVQNVPKRPKNAKTEPQNRLPNPSASSIMSDISLVSLCSETQANEVTEEEEIFAIGQVSHQHLLDKNYSLDGAVYSGTFLSIFDVLWSIFATFRQFWSTFGQFESP